MMDKRPLYIILYEIIYVFLMSVVFVIFIQQAVVLLRKAGDLNMNTAHLLQYSALLQSNADVLKSVYQQFIAALIILAITTVFIYTLLNMFIWLRIAKKKLSEKNINLFFKKSFIWNLCWMLGFIAILYLFEPASYPKIFLPYLALFLYFTTCFHICIFSKKKLYKISIQNAHKMLLLFIPAMLALLLLTNIVSYFYANNYLILGIIIIYTSFLRVYAYDYAKKIK